MQGTPDSTTGGVGPTPPASRRLSLDLLRGLATLGILPMNLPTFALSSYALTYPPLLAALDAPNLWVWASGHLLFELKMMALFSILLGAGVALASERFESRPGTTPGLAAILFYRRMAWLALLGLLHAHLLWFGDILFIYALCSMLLFPMRKLPPRRLALIASALLLIPPALNLSIGLHAASLRAAAESLPLHGAPADPDHQNDLDAWSEMRRAFLPTAPDLAAERTIALGGYSAYQSSNSSRAWFMETSGLLLWSLWRVCGLMLLGIALLRWGVLTAERSPRFYRRLALAGLSAGAAAGSIGIALKIAHAHDFVRGLLLDDHFNYFGSVPMALGYLALVMLIVQSGVWQAAQHALAGVGRMALTNYLLQSALGATIFAGWGLGFWGSLSRAELWIVVAALWALQLALSAAWLRLFPFGPAEWVWRRLTYGNG